MRDLLDAVRLARRLDAFADSWNRLELDTYMADGGRYRRRRHATYAARPDGRSSAQPHQPHYQALDYNPLNGGIARWFEPIEPAIGAGSSMTTILAFCRSLFDIARVGRAAVAHRSAPVPDRGAVGRAGPADARRAAPRRRRLRAGAAGRPPQHRQRRDDDSRARRPAARPVHADRSVRRRARRRHRVAHGVTPVEPIDPALPAYRDVLVVTFSEERLDRDRWTGRHDRATERAVPHVPALPAVPAFNYL